MTAHVRHSIRFLLNDETVEIDDAGATTTLLDFLRLERRLTGTKEGCAEGDCGACTVLVGRLVAGKLEYKTVNACIRFLGSLDATHVVTVEHLTEKTGSLHPVQQAMVDEHGSQCGFCTPGFVMSLYALWLSRAEPTAYAVEKALQGNLCRCTGYAPIVRAAEAMTRTPPDTAADRLTAMRDAVTERLHALCDGARVEAGPNDDRFIVPADADDLAGILEASPEATIVAGATDVGLWVTKAMRAIAPVVFIGHLDALHATGETEAGVTLGSCVTYSEAFATLARHFPTMDELWDRIGGEQIRNMGTVGGNIANGSPIGDTPAPLIALGATVTLRKGDTRRTLPLEAFFIDYGKQDRAPGEFVETIFVPALGKADRFAVYKVTKRRDEDISAVCGAFRITLDDAGSVIAARVAFGGMAATPKRAAAVENELIGKPWDEETARAAAPIFETDFKPLSDWRATADYRLLAARNLLIRFALESGIEPARIRRHAPVPATV